MSLSERGYPFLGLSASDRKRREWMAHAQFSRAAPSRCWHGRPARPGQRSLIVPKYSPRWGVTAPQLWQAVAAAGAAGGGV